MQNFFSAHATKASKHKSEFHFYEETKDKCRLISVFLCMHIGGTMVLDGWLTNISWPFNKCSSAVSHRTLAASGTWCILSIEALVHDCGCPSCQLEPLKCVVLFIILTFSVFHHFSLNCSPLTLVSVDVSEKLLCDRLLMFRHTDQSNQILYILPQNLLDEKCISSTACVYVHVCLS